MEGFFAANADLNGLVAQASAALQRRSGGRMVLQLTLVRKDMEGLLYVLMVSQPTDLQTQGLVLEGLLVGTQGYPIASGTIKSISPPVFVPVNRIDDKSELVDHFGGLFSYGSPLTIHLGHLLGIVARPL